MAEGRREYFRCELVELYHARAYLGRQWFTVSSYRRQYGWEYYKCCGDFNRNFVAVDHDAAGESDRHRGSDSYVHRGCVWHCAVELPVAKGRRQHLRREFGKLYDACPRSFR